MSAYALLPYCGAPPSPDELWSRWRLDPIVIGILVLAWALYVFAYRRGAHTLDPARIGRHELLLGSAGWIVAAFALISPLCPLSVSLFAARATQHVVLTIVAAPLVVLGRPLTCLAVAFAADRRAFFESFQRKDFSIGVALVFAAVVWFWHMPRPYEVTFQSVAAYWAMHLTMFGAAVWLWSCLLRRGEVVSGLFASILSAIQMGFLGAVITLSPRALYTPHFLTTDAWGLSPLQDQQLGGVIMWVVGCTAFFVVAMWGVARSLAREPKLRPKFRALPINRIPSQMQP